MTTTLSTFKEQQDKIANILKKLQQFIEQGRDFGLMPDKHILSKIEKAIKTTEHPILKVALIGGFSEGKTSIASAWLERLDQSMNISQQESSNEVRVYTLDNDIELIDTPGLFGFKEQQNAEGNIEKYKEITKKYVSEAHLVLYVMNSANPIKESHTEDLKWLFRDLNLLPRTIFVLSRFDEVTDIEDDWSYREILNIKKENVLERLQNILELTSNEIDNIKIVGVSANPFGEGTQYWLDNREEFIKLSRISTLQDATKNTIQDNGGSYPIVLEARKAILQDILIQQIPVLKKQQHIYSEEVEKLQEATKHLYDELEPMGAKISRVQVELIEYVKEHLTSLITQLGRTNLATFSDFFENTIGKDGVLLKNSIEQAVRTHSQSINRSLERLRMDFDNEKYQFQQNIESTLLNQGLKFLSSQKITGSQVLAARDGIVSAGKMVNIDLAKTLKFKPWGAQNLAGKISGVLAIVGLAMELADSYQQQEQEQQFLETKKELKEFLEDQRKLLIDQFSDSNYIKTFFPNYLELETEFNTLKEESENSSLRKARFDSWIKEGEIIEATFREL